MDCKIRSRQIFVTALLVVCHVTEIATQTSSSITVTLPTTATATVSVTIPGSSTVKGSGTGITNVPVVTPKPAPLTCSQDVCTSNCSTFTTPTTCTSDKTKGCKVVKTTVSGVDTYTYNCSTTVCDSSASNVYCCFDNNCNPSYEPKQSKATTMFGNLVSFTIIVMLGYYM